MLSHSHVFGNQSLCCFICIFDGFLTGLGILIFVFGIIGLLAAIRPTETVLAYIGANDWMTDFPLGTYKVLAGGGGLVTSKII